jgi:hypothetical protein
MSEAETFCTLKYGDLSNVKFLDSLPLNVYVNWAEEIITEYISVYEFAHDGLKFLTDNGGREDFNKVYDLYNIQRKRKDFNNDIILKIVINLSFIRFTVTRGRLVLKILNELSSNGKDFLAERYEKLLITKLYEYDQNQLTKQCA